MVYFNEVAKIRATLNITQEAKDELDTVKSSQSYDGIIRELVKFWRDKKREYWTRRQAQRQKNTFINPLTKPE